MQTIYKNLKSNIIQSFNQFLEIAEKNTLSLEKNHDHASMKEILRCLHSIKGSAGLFDLKNVFALTHSFETFLNTFKNSGFKMSDVSIDLILEGIDQLKKVANNIDQYKKSDFKYLIGKFETHSKALYADSLELQRRRPRITKLKVNIPKNLLEKAKKKQKNLFYLSFNFSPQKVTRIAQLNKYFISISRKYLILKHGPIGEDATNIRKFSSPFYYYFIIMSDKEKENFYPLIQTMPVRNFIQLYEAQAKHPTPSGTSVVSGNKNYSILRVNADLIDQLMQKIEETILIRNKLRNKINTYKDFELHSICRHLETSITSLKENILKTKLQNLGTISQPLFRIVRDTSQLANKKVNFIMNLNDIEVDKNILGVVEECLIHIIRNAIDHGIELPSEREKLGKRSEGSLLVNAKMNSKEIVISIIDDGRGIQIEKIKTKLIQDKIISKKKVDQMKKKEITNFIFKSGFSTLGKLTKISGRGVGLDSVLSSLKKINARIAIQSVEGKSSIFKLIIPQTTNIISCLIVKHIDWYFGIQDQFIETIIPIDHQKLYYVKDYAVYEFQYSILPLILLDHVCKCKSNQKQNLNSFIIVIRAGKYRFGIWVNEINDIEEVVVRKLEKHLDHVLEYFGSAVLSNGNISLILNIPVLFDNYLSKDSKMLSREYEKVKKNISKIKRGTRSFMLFQIQDQAMAMFTKYIVRMQELSEKDIPSTLAKDSIEYKNKKVPLLRLENIYNLRSVIPSKKLYLVFVQVEDTIYSFLTNEIIQIYEDAPKLHKGNIDHGPILGYCRWDGKQTIFIDPIKLLKSYI